MPPVASPALATVPGVELARTGQWALSSGDWQPKREDFVSAVAAMDCPAVRPPRIRLGHVDPRFDGEPAVGSVTNLRVEQGGHSLVGDLDGIPAWLADTDAIGRSVLSSAFPDRSVEGVYGFQCQLGHQHPFVLTGLALLGVTPPGVGTLRSLRDVATLYGIDPAPAPVTGTAVSAVFHAAAKVRTGAMVALVPAAEHAARLAVDGGEAGEQLHLTVVYLSDAVDIDEPTRRATITALATAFTGAGSVDAEGFSVAAFNPTSDERDTLIVLGVTGAEVDDAQSLAMQTLATVPGLTVPEQHKPFNAHVTLAYSDDLGKVKAYAGRCGPIAFDRLRIAFGGLITDIPLTPSVAAGRHSYDPDQERDPDGKWGDGVPGPGGGSPKTTAPAADKLKLTGRIALKPDQSLTSSSRVGDGNGDMDMLFAVVSSPSGPSEARIGIIPAGDSSRWRAADLGGTAVMDAGQVRQLRTDLADAATAATKAAKAADKAWKSDGPPDDPVLLGTEPVASGGIATGWADVRWDVHVTDDDPASWQTVVYAGDDSDGIVFDPKRFAKLVGHLGRVEADLAGTVTAQFDPNQRRDPNGMWGDGIGPDAPADPYGPVHDEASAADLDVRVYERGDFNLSSRDHVLREVDADFARDMADQLDWAVEQIRDGERSDDGDVEDYVLLGDDGDTLIGYSPDGQVHVAFTPDGRYDPDLADDVDRHAHLDVDEATDLADVLRRMADVHDRLMSGDAVAASTGRTTTVPTATIEALTPESVRAAWNSSGAPDAQWVAEIAPDLSYVVVVKDPERTFSRHRVHVSARGQITFGRGQAISLGYVDASGAIAASRTVFASRDAAPVVASTEVPPVHAPTDQPAEPVTPDEPTPPAVTPPAPTLPAAEPEPNTDPKEDPVSTLSTDVRSRLGLTEDADDAAVLAAFDALKVKAETPAPEQVAASAAATQEADELRKEITVLASQVSTMSTELAAEKASKAATVKASVFDDAVKAGKIKPADREQWEADYDAAPAAVTRVLASIAAGTAVPVTASGHTGGDEPTGTSFDDAAYERLFGEKASI